MASESYYRPIRECGIWVILLLFPVGSEYNGEGQGLMQFVSFNSVKVSPLSFNGVFSLMQERISSTRHTPKTTPKNPWDFHYYLYFLNTVGINKLLYLAGPKEAAVWNVFSCYHHAKMYIEIPHQSRSLHFSLFNCIDTVIFWLVSKNVKAYYPFPHKCTVWKV